MKNILIAVLLALYPLSVWADWNIPGIVRDETYQKEVDRRKKAEEEKGKAQKQVVILASIVGVLALGLFLKLICNACSFFVKCGRDSLKRK